MLERFKRWTYGCVAAEVSRMTRYADRVIQLDPLPGDTGMLREAVQAPVKSAMASGALDELPARDERDCAVFLFNGNFNSSLDIQGLLESGRRHMRRSDRVVVVLYNAYFAWMYRIADRLGLRHGPECTTFVTRTALAQLARLSGFEVVRLRPAVYLPWHFFGLGNALNAVLPAIPGLRWLSLVGVAVLRPIRELDSPRSVTVVIPARNERGNIEHALERMPRLGAGTEVLFIEGHSNDGTWEEIQRVVSAWDGRGGLSVRAYQQTGRGKVDAVRLGFSKATGDLLTILDADLTMPPEMLPRFVDAYARGLGDFVNGTRLVYPMEGEAMRFLNRLGNVFFAKAVSWVVEAPLADTLCGTKLVSRRDYERFVAWRGDFGDFDPFGDFELLFPAAVLGLGVIDVPVAYRSRTYGSTNIRRFRDGFRLLRMVLTGFARVRMGAPGTATPPSARPSVREGGPADRSFREGGR
jgi:hypothetical protein